MNWCEDDVTIEAMETDGVSLPAAQPNALENNCNSDQLETCSISSLLETTLLDGTCMNTTDIDNRHDTHVRNHNT